jgi:hypothetical protein
MRRSPGVRAVEVVAMTLVGDGVVHLTMPRRPTLRWAPGALRTISVWLHERPMATRASGVLLIAAGLGVVSRLPAR